MSISRRTRKIIAAFSLFALALFIWGFLIEPNRLIVHTETIVLSTVDQPRPLRIATIGDIHAGSPFINTDKLKRIVELTNSQQPDLIVLLGDYVVQDNFYQTHIDPEITAGILKDLHAPLGVYAVLGNHDSSFDGNRVMRAFEASGIDVLNNEVKELRHDKRSVWLVGLADAWTNRHDIAGTVKQLPANASIIMLTHHPDILNQIPDNVQLVLAAHTHGGQVNLPLLGRLVVPSQYGQKYAAGLVKENGKTMFVTTGIGTSIIPVRFRVPPEIALLTVQGL
jgi:uncharacterized protein